MLTVYVIQNDSGKLYTGYTSDIEKRLERHNKILPSKSTSYTAKQGGNWKLVYSESYTTREEAVKREKELKSYQGRQFVKNIINNMGR